METAMLQLIDRLEIPESHAAILLREGFLPPYMGDLRRFPRRCMNVEATLQLGEGLPGFRRTQEHHAVKVIDLSRGGIGFLHSDQLYPGEEVNVVLTNAKTVKVEIRWCRRLGPKCYQLGGRFTAASI